MADIDLKTETPDASLPADGFLFGADSQAAASPSVYTRASVTTTVVGNLSSSDSIAWNSDLLLTRKGAANIRLGAADAAAPVAQTLSVQGVVAGTTNTAGANLTIAGSQGTGTGAGGSIVFQVAPAGSSGTAQNALATFAEITSARALNLYNTFTDASNYERLRIDWSSNVATIRTEGAGTGFTNRRLDIISGGQLNFLSQGGSSIFFFTNGTARWYVDGANGNLLAFADNTYDIGAAAATRPRNLFLGSYAQLSEMTAPAAPAANGVRIYAVDNGSGKTQLMALFATGAAQQIAIEP
jgi:hypothetical protein